MKPKAKAKSSTEKPTQIAKLWNRYRAAVRKSEECGRKGDEVLRRLVASIKVDPLIRLSQLRHPDFDGTPDRDRNYQYGGGYIPEAIIRLALEQATIYSKAPYDLKRVYRLCERFDLAKQVRIRRERSPLRRAQQRWERKAEHYSSLATDIERQIINSPMSDGPNKFADLLIKVLLYNTDADPTSHELTGSIGLVGSIVRDIESILMPGIPPTEKAIIC